MCVKESVKYQMSYVHSPQLSLSLRCFDIILSLNPSVCPLMSEPTVGSHGCRGWGGCPISAETMLVSQEDDGAFYSAPAAAAARAARWRCCLLFPPSWCKSRSLIMRKKLMRLRCLWCRNSSRGQVLARAADIKAFSFRLMWKQRTRASCFCR